MKILVAGLGSMGKRRIRLLKKIDFSIQIIGVDKSADRCNTAEKRVWYYHAAGFDSCT